MDLIHIADAHKKGINDFELFNVKPNKWSLCFMKKFNAIIVSYNYITIKFHFIFNKAKKCNEDESTSLTWKGYMISCHFNKLQHKISLNFYFS